MKTSRIYESLLIILILVLFCILAFADSGITNGNKNLNSGNSTSVFTTMIQINHPELLFGPVEGSCNINYFNHSKSYHFSRVTTTNSYCRSRPLAPSGVFSDKKVFGWMVEKYI